MTLLCVSYCLFSVGLCDVAYCLHVCGYVMIVFSPGEALVMYLQLQPATMGALTFYLPVLVPTEVEMGFI